MINLDDYLNTPDEHFNTNVQYWYFNRSTCRWLESNKPFEVFIKTIYDVYFFILENSNKPFACIEKIKAIAKENKFNTTDELLLIDNILGVLFHHPNVKNLNKVFIQIVDYRNDISPYIDNPEIQDSKWFFNINAIKSYLNTIETTLEKKRYLTNLLFDYSAKIYEFEEIELEYYQSIGLENWIKTELSRCEFEQKLETHTTTPKEKPRLGEFTNSQLVLIFYYFFKYSGIELRVNTDVAPIAKFLHLVTGKEFSNTQSSDFYKKLSKAPNHISDKNLIDDLNHIKPLFQKVELNEIVKMVDNEIDQCRTAIKETKKGKR